MLRIMARMMIVVLSRRAAGLSLAGGLKNTLKGVCGPAEPRRRPLFGVGMALSADSAPTVRRGADPWPEPSATNAHVEPPQPD